MTRVIRSLGSRRACACACACVYVGSPVARSEGRVSLKVSKTAASRLSGWRGGSSKPRLLLSLDDASQKLVSPPRNRLILFVIGCQIGGRGMEKLYRVQNGQALEDERAVLEVGSFRDAIGLGSNSFVGERGAGRGEWSR